MLDAWTYVVPDPDDASAKIEVRLVKDLGNVYSFARGDLGKIKKVFSNFKIVDKRAAPKVDHPITMQSQLFTQQTDPQGRNQQDVFDAWLKKRYGQIQAPARFGKCHAQGTLVKTPTGSATIESLSPGDTVYGFNRDGSISPCKVLRVFDNGVKHNVVDLTHKGRVVASVTEDHVMLAFHRGAPKNTQRESTVRDILKGLRPTLVEAYAEIPGGVVSFPQAYALGALIGDKTQRYAGFKREIPYYAEWLEGKKAHEKICDLEVVRSWTRESQLNFLAGLMDTNGSIRLSKDGQLILQLQIQAKSVLNVVAALLMDLFQAPVTWGLDNRTKYVNGATHMLIVSNNKFSKRILRELPTVLPQKQWKPEYASLSSRSPEGSILVKGSQKTYSERCYDIQVANDTNLYLLANGVVTHNSITVSAIVMELGLKTLVLSHSWDILDQFERTIREHSDVDDLELLSGKRLVSRMDKLDWDDFEHVEIVLSTWQGWNHPNKRRYLKKYRDRFGTIMVDECHLSQAECYSRVLSSFNPKYIFGNTATPNKLNELHVIIENIIGPVTATGQSKQMDCIVEFISTGFVVKEFARSRWTTMVNRIVKSDTRNKLIVNEAVQDVANGRNLLITTDRTGHAKELVALLEAEGIASIAVTGQTTARDGLWDLARSGKVQVVVAMRSITRLGIDVPKWDTFYNIIPTSNPYNYYQELSRIRTYYEGKPVPLIKDFVDAPVSASYGAIFGTLKKRIAVYEEQGFTIGPHLVKKASSKLSFGRRKVKTEAKSTS